MLSVFMYGILHSISIVLILLSSLIYVKSSTVALLISFTNTLSASKAFTLTSLLPFTFFILDILAVQASFFAGIKSLPNIEFIRVDFPELIVATTAISSSEFIAFSKFFNIPSLFIPSICVSSTYLIRSFISPNLFSFSLQGIYDKSTFILSCFKSISLTSL